MGLQIKTKKKKKDCNLFWSFGDLIWRLSWKPSANIQIFTGLSTIRGKAFKNIKKRSGPKWDPSGTSEVTEYSLK